MLVSELNIGLEVVRSMGDYTVGRVGTKLQIKESRAQVAWRFKGIVKTWVHASALEPTSIPYEILPPTYLEKPQRVYPAYRRK